MTGVMSTCRPCTPISETISQDKPTTQQEENLIKIDVTTMPVDAGGRNTILALSPNIPIPTYRVLYGKDTFSHIVQQCGDNKIRK